MIISFRCEQTSRVISNPLLLHRTFQQSKDRRMKAGPATDKYTEGIGTRIRWVRRHNKLNQDELGNKLNITRVTVSGNETQRLLPSRTIVHKLCDLYGVDPAWIYYGVGERMPGYVEYPKEGALTPAQESLIELIKQDAEFASGLQRKLWSEAVARKSGEIEVEDATL